MPQPNSALLTIDKIPADVLGLIFGFLGDKAEGVSASLVCKQFRNIINDKKLLEQLPYPAFDYAAPLFNRKFSFKGNISCMESLPNGMMVVSVFGPKKDQKEIVIINPNTGERKKSWQLQDKHHEHAITAFAIISATQFISASKQSNTMDFWDTTTGSNISLVNPFEVEYIAYSSASQQVVTGSAKGDVAIWDIQERKILFKFKINLSSAMGLNSKRGVVSSRYAVTLMTGLGVLSNGYVVTANLRGVEIWNNQTGKSDRTIDLTKLQYGRSHVASPHIYTMKVSSEDEICMTDNLWAKFAILNSSTGDLKVEVEHSRLCEFISTLESQGVILYFNEKFFDLPFELTYCAYDSKKALVHENHLRNSSVKWAMKNPNPIILPDGRIVTARMKMRDTEISVYSHKDLTKEFYKTTYMHYQFWDKVMLAVTIILAIVLTPLSLAITLPLFAFIRSQQAIQKVEVTTQECAEIKSNRQAQLPNVDNRDINKPKKVLLSSDGEKQVFLMDKEQKRRFLLFKNPKALTAQEVQESKLKSKAIMAIVKSQRG